MQGYEDTIGDLSFGLVGAALGATFAVLATSGVEAGEESDPEPARNSV